MRKEDDLLTDEKVDAKTEETKSTKYKHKTTMPGLGDTVWYYYCNTKDADGNLAPHTAFVAYISDHDDTVNLMVLEHSGMPTNAAHVPVVAKNAKPEDLAGLEDFCMVPK